MNLQWLMNSCRSIHPGGEIPFDSDRLAGQFTSLVSVLRLRSIPLAIDSGLNYCRIPL